MTRTGKLVFQETPEDWSASFEDAWTRSGGHLQSLAFALGALRRIFTLPEFQAVLDLHHTADGVAFEHLEVHDYGCACGDGTALLQAAFPGARIVGLDTSEVAVATARRRWPGVTFTLGDVRRPERDASIIFTSHTIEHTEDAASCIRALIPCCDALIVLVPLITAAQHGGHEGAEETERWLARCPEPAHQGSFNIMRRNPDAGVWLAEGSLMYVWQGSRKS